MRYRFTAPFVLALALPAVAGCEDSAKDRLQGKWIGESIENFHPSQQQRASGWITDTSFEFTGTRVTVTVAAESPRQGTFKVAEVSDDEVEVSFLRPTGETDIAALQFEGEKHLRWKLGDGRTVVMRKVN